ncbi:hypothetical protein [Streptomyces sp. LNU-CPARS28]|uniref:hypothetical protein n=1 Tax=Streptomyces sp. LNU-CPARS28 TaxID=3137371 RepID=UPI003134E827
MIALVGEDPQTVAALIGGAVVGSAVSLAALKYLVDSDSRPVPAVRGRRLPAWRPGPVLPTSPARPQVPGPCEETQPLGVVQAHRARHRRPGPPHTPALTVGSGEGGEGR